MKTEEVRILSESFADAVDTSIGLSDEKRQRQPQIGTQTQLNLAVPQYESGQARGQLPNIEIERITINGEEFEVEHVDSPLESSEESESFNDPDSFNKLTFAGDAAAGTLSKEDIEDSVTHISASSGSGVTDNSVTRAHGGDSVVALTQSTTLGSLKSESTSSITNLEKTP